MIYESVNLSATVQSLPSYSAHTVKGDKVGVWLEGLETGREALLQPCEHDKPWAEHVATSGLPRRWERVNGTQWAGLVRLKEVRSAEAVGRKS